MKENAIMQCQIFSQGKFLNVRKLNRGKMFFDEQRRWIFRFIDQSVNNNWWLGTVTVHLIRTIIIISPQQQHQQQEYFKCI